jgi:hypothetical protein
LVGAKTVGDVAEWLVWAQLADGTKAQEQTVRAKVSKFLQHKTVFAALPFLLMSQIATTDAGPLQIDCKIQGQIGLL